MNASGARRWVTGLGQVQAKPTGGSALIHVRRVAESVPPGARAIAWLYEAVERSAISEQELIDHGLSLEEVEAIRLLTRSRDEHSDRAYLLHTESIARAQGLAGALARVVMRADLGDRLHHPSAAANGWRPPYELALTTLGEAAANE